MRRSSTIQRGRSRQPRWQRRLLQLNRRQIHILIVGFLFVFGIGLYPPWQQLHRNEVGGISKRPAGFHLINAPPTHRWDPTWIGAHIHVGLLAFEFCMVALVTALLVYGARDKNPLTTQLMRRYDAD